jgi:hypothetical protein
MHDRSLRVTPRLLTDALPLCGLLAASAAITPAAAGATATQATSIAGDETHFVCEQGGSFTVSRSGTTALVRFGDGGYRLERRRSSIGERFSSLGATLIIDGDFAAFVAEDRLDVSGCTSTATIAKAPRKRR